MKLEGHEMRELLHDEAERKRRSYRRVTLLAYTTVFVGLIWLGYSAYNATKLAREASQLNARVQKQATELDQLQSNVNQARAELAGTNQKLENAQRALSEAEAVLRNIAQGKANPKAQAQQALQEMSQAANLTNTPGSGNANTAPTQTTISPPMTEITPTTNSATLSMPDVVGLSEKEAFSKLEGMKLNVRGTEIISNCKAHIVYDQTPKAGAFIKAGDFVQIFYCSGK
jgi:cell division protein FtsB